MIRFSGEFHIFQVALSGDFYLDQNLVLATKFLFPIRIFMFMSFSLVVTISDRSVVWRNNLQAFSLCNVLFDLICLIIIFLIHISLSLWVIGRSLNFSLIFTLC